MLGIFGTGSELGVIDMAKIDEDTKGSTRNLPISDKLKAVLLQAAEAAGVESVRVISGAQCDKGTCNRRTGSTRHDISTGAADLQLYVNGIRAKFTDKDGSPVFETFVKAAAAAGATGIGAGENYMGPDTIHVGFGQKAIWGEGGKAANAPSWLIEAVKAGWKGTHYDAPLDVGKAKSFNLDSDDEEVEEDQIN